MTQQLVQHTDTPVRRRRRSYAHREGPSASRAKKVDAATKASMIQLQADQRELIYSSFAFLMKIGLLSLGIASLLKMGSASHQLVKRHIELSSVLQFEKNKSEQLNLRFDRLFTIGGDTRLMEEQTQWITPNSIRVIWR